MLALKVVCVLSALAGAQAGYLGAALTPYAFPPAPVALPPVPVALPPVPVALPPPALPLPLPAAPVFPGPGFGVLPYAHAPFSPFGFHPAVLKTPAPFGIPAPIVKSYSLGYPAPVIKSFGHFDYHETPLIKAAPLGHFHLRAPLIRAFPSYAPSFGHHHDHHFFA